MKPTRWVNCLVPTLFLLLNQSISYKCLAKSNHNRTTAAHQTGRTLSTKLVGEAQVRRVARNAANKMQLLNSRVDQIEAQIAEDQSLLTGNIINGSSLNNQPALEFNSPYSMDSSDSLSAAPNEPNELVIQSAPQLEPQPQETWNAGPSGSQDELPAAAPGKLNVSSRTGSERVWSKPIIKSVIPSPQTEGLVKVGGQREETQMRQADQSDTAGDQDAGGQDQASDEAKLQDSATTRSADSDLLDEQQPPLQPAPVQQPSSSVSLTDKYAGSKSLPTLLASTWNSNQNFNYFSEQNLKNHGARLPEGHLQSAGYKQPTRNKFQNMTVVNSDRDLSNSFSSHSGPQYPTGGSGSTTGPIVYENNRRSALSTYSAGSQNRHLIQNQAQNTLASFRNDTAVNQRFNPVSQQAVQQADPIRWPVLAGPLEHPSYTNSQPTSGSVISPMLAIPDGSQSDLLLKHRISMSAVGGSEESTSYPPVSFTTDPQSIGDGPPGFVGNQADQLDSMLNLQQQQQQQQQQQTAALDREAAGSQPAMNYQSSTPNVGARIDEAQAAAATLGDAGASPDEIQSSYGGHQIPRYYSTLSEQQQSMNSQQMSGGSGISQPGSGDEQRQQGQLQSLNKIASAMIAQNPVLAPLELATLIQRHQQQRMLTSPSRLQSSQQQVTTAANPISRSYYITDTQKPPQTSAASYRRYSPDPLANYLSRQAISDQMSSGVDLSPYSAATHFQPIYANLDGRTLRTQQQYYRAALAAAAATKAANEQALLAASSGLMGSSMPASLFATAAANSPPVYESPSLKSSDELPGPQPRHQLQQQHQQQQAHHQQQQQQQHNSGQLQSQYLSYKPRSYLNSLFKPTASSRYYYSPTLLSPISLAAPASLHSLYAPALGAADLAASLPQMTYSSPYAIHQSQLEQAQQYQAALAAAAAASGLQAHYIDPDMAESSLVATDSGNFAEPSSMASSSANEDSQPAASSSSSTSTKKSTAPWSSIAGLLLGVIPFGMIMAALMPVMAVTGRKKRELELGARNFSHLLKWRAPSKVLEAIMKASSQNASSLINSTSHNWRSSSEHEPSKARTSSHQDLINDNLILDQLGSTNSTTTTGATASTSSSSPTTAHSIKSKMLKVLGSALNGLITATTQTMKRRHQAAGFEQLAVGQQQQPWTRIPAIIKSSLKLDNLFNVADYKRQLTTFRQRAMVQHQQPMQRSGGEKQVDYPLARAALASVAQVNVTQYEQPSSLASTPSNNNNGSRGHLEICLNQFLCRLAVKLDKSFRPPSSSSTSSTTSPALSTPPETGKMEWVTKKYINQLINQIEAALPADIQQNSTSTPSAKSDAADKKSPSLLLDNLDNLYRTATKNQCSTAYSCIELLQLERMLMKMQLKLS